MTAAIYSRISKDPLEEGAGVDRQERDCRKMLAQQGIHDPLVFRDNDRSAWQRNRKRPAWDEVLERIRIGEIAVLAVWHPDRLMRQPRDLEELIDAADRGGLRLVSAGGGRDLANPDDRLVLRILVAAACKASDDSSRRIKRAFDERAAAGLPHNGERLFGLTTDRTALVPDEAAALRDAASRLLAGESLRSICADLDGRFATTRGGKRWTQHALRGMLLRPSVAGFLTQRGETVGKAAWPPVLDEPTWRAVCELLLDPDRRSLRTSTYRHLLSGLLYCSRCTPEAGGMARMRSLKQTGSARRRYACPSCFRNAASEPQLDAIVVAAVDERLSMTPPPRPTVPAGVTSELDAARARLDLVTREFTGDPVITPAQLRMMSKRLHDRIRVLEAQAARAGAVSAPLSFDGWTSQSPDERRRIVAAVVDRIDLVPAGKAGRYVDPGRLQISWR